MDERGAEAPLSRDLGTPPRAAHAGGRGGCAHDDASASHIKTKVMIGGFFEMPAAQTERESGNAEATSETLLASRAIDDKGAHEVSCEPNVPHTHCHSDRHFGADT